MTLTSTAKRAVLCLPAMIRHTTSPMKKHLAANGRAPLSHGWGRRILWNRVGGRCRSRLRLRAGELAAESGSGLCKLGAVSCSECETGKLGAVRISTESTLCVGCDFGPGHGAAATAGLADLAALGRRSNLGPSRTSKYSYIWTSACQHSSFNIAALDSSNLF